MDVYGFTACLGLGSIILSYDLFVYSSDKKGKEDEEDEESEVEQGRRPLQSRKSKQSSDVKEGKTLFIRNLSFDSSEESVHHLFERFGEIDYCKLLEDKRTGHSRGMAFVKFKTVESAEQCLAEPGEVLHVEITIFSYIC